MASSIEEDLLTPSLADELAPCKPIERMVIMLNERIEAREGVIEKDRAELAEFKKKDTDFLRRLEEEALDIIQRFKEADSYDMKFKEAFGMIINAIVKLRGD